MTEISEVPTVSRAVVTGYDPARRIKDATATKDMSVPSYDQIRQHVAREQQRLQEKYPTFSKELITSCLSVIYGPLVLDERSLSKNRATPEQRELSASIQHQETHALLHATSPSAPEAYAQRMYDFAKVMEGLSQSAFNDKYALSEFWTGTKSEVTVIKALLAGNHRVVLPNYTHGNTQVREWDVEKGIDFYTISPEGTVYLVDAKGRRNNEVGETLTKPLVTTLPVDTEMANLPKSLREQIHTLSPKAIYRTTILVPTHSSYVHGLPRIDYPPKSPKEALTQFASLKNIAHQHAIIAALPKGETL